MKQKPFIFNNYLIISALDKPVEIKNDASKDSIREKFDDIVYEPDKYSYWGWDKELNVIIFFQNKNDRPVYYNQNGLVMLYLNDKNEVMYYSQTMLGETEALAEKQQLIKPKRAIETLYNSNELHSGDHIDSVKIGFHTRVPFDSGVQVFAPIWKVNVNNEKDYFVNAIEGYTFSTEEQDFLLEVIDNNIERLEAADESKSPVPDILDDLQKRQELLHEEGVKQ